MQTQIVSSPCRLSDSELVEQVRHLACHERRATAALVAHLAELDERRLYRAEGCSSLFTYCVEVLHLSEGSAYNRIKAARAARQFPVIVEMLARGFVHVTTVRRLARHLTAENHLDLLNEASHKSKREVEAVVARLEPRPPAATTVRRVQGRKTANDPGSGGNYLSEEPALDFPATPVAPDPGRPADTHSERGAAQEEIDRAILPVVVGKEGASVSNDEGRAAPASRHRAGVVPLAPDMYSVHFTADAVTHKLLCQARELLGHQIPDGDAGAVIGIALKVLVEKLSRQKFGAETTRKVRRQNEVSSQSASDRPAARRSADIGPRDRTGRRVRSRHIPTSVRREVWNRDAGQCAFIARSGRRCTERARLEFHHVRPFAAGGCSETGNVQLRCKSHNAYESEVWFGSRVARSWATERVVPERVDVDNGASRSGTSQRVDERVTRSGTS